MSAKVFLSLSYVDADFVRLVRSRLPIGLAYFYEESFANGEALIHAMERGVDDATIFVLFASKQSLASPWVGFEIDRARLNQIKKPNHRILVFPTDPSVSVQDLPEWLRAYWVAKAGWTPFDIARYVTGILLEPNSGLSGGAVRVIGRGKTVDQLERLTADHLQRTGQSPSVFFLSGFRGVGRRTLASFYMRSAMTADANLPYGPLIVLSPQADLIDIHRALRIEISPTISSQDALRERAVFEALSLDEQIEDVHRLLGHFRDLGEAVTIVSAGGFFEDDGDPKDWLIPFLTSVARPLTLFVVSNRQIPPAYLVNTKNILQMRVPELDEQSTKALMIFTAERLQVPNFAVSNELVRAIGGHADVANAAVRLASVKGTHILERDPRQLFNVQNLILGESIDPSALSEVQKKILCLLSWVPKMNGSLLEAILLADGVTSDEILTAIDGLALGCLIDPSGPEYAISPAIRMLFRRFNITPPELLQKFSQILAAEWRSAERLGQFRTDLFESFVYMNALEGAALPRELRPLLTPGMLHDVIRDTYARGKDESDTALLELVISWGEMAGPMKMSEATREEILSTVVRAKIRIGKFDAAATTIKDMAAKGYKSVAFLQGHLYRRQENYPRAIELLVEAARGKKINRSAIHELALAYKKSGRLADLRALLREHGNLIRDSAMFADFQIGVDLARGDLTAAESGIERLSVMPDDEGRSDIRRAQLLMRNQQYHSAKVLLTSLLKNPQGSALRIRSLRATCAARDGDFDLSRKDIEFVGKFASWGTAVKRLEANLLVEQKRPAEARALLGDVAGMGPEDRLLYARALEIEAELPTTSLPDKNAFKDRAAEIRRENNFWLEYDFGDEG